ncbi:ras-related protein rab-22a [Plakobranchus ocellatus]|uniref:Ras-related protein rab-22a n=1 Tax=Plakobranchus ocellatus TaxID=259542 RepID=A0AAV4A7M9_9GAST|nr:ras-related protein rab-22a [Plakobranchus ocellatus]
MSMRDVKVCLLGESGVGKSSIVMRFVADRFKQALESTIGASFMTKTINYRALAPMYYRGSSAAIIVYDVTREVSFQAVKAWVQELQRHGPSRIIIAIAGNKCDLEDLREVREKDAQEYAKQIGAIFCETSAMTSVNIAELFQAIARLLPPEDNNDTLDHQRGNTIKLRSSRSRGHCCGGGSAAGDTGDGLRANRSSQRGYSYAS